MVENIENNIENIKFDNILLDEYKEDIEKINLIFIKLENDKSVKMLTRIILKRNINININI